MAPHSMRLAPRPKYLALALAAMQRSIAYRGATLLNLVAALVWVVVLYYLWRTVFAANPRVGSFDWHRMRTYILLAYAVNALLGFYTETRMMNTIRTGDVAVELTRPVDYLKAQLAQALGAAAVESVLSSLVAGLVGIFLLKILPPPSPAVAFLFLLSVGLGFVVKFLISYLTGLLCFWTMNSIGLLWARVAVTNILSGALIPLQFFPPWLHTLALIVPFQAVVHAPLSIYLGDAQGADVARVLAVQLFWVVALWLLARVLWFHSVRALTVQGG